MTKDGPTPGVQVLVIRAVRLGRRDLRLPSGEKETCEIMKSFRGTTWTLAVIWLARLLSPGIRAQIPTGGSTSQMPTEHSAQLEELRKQINRLQAELAAARKRRGDTSKAGAAFSASTTEESANPEGVRRHVGTSHCAWAYHLMGIFATTIPTS